MENTKQNIRENPKYCIFENKLCRYANNDKEMKTFECNCPSDDAMPCRK